MKIGLVGPSYQETMLPFDAQRSINLYPVLDQNGGKEVSALYGTPGLRLLSNVGAGPNRGHFYATNGRAFVVVGAGLYEIRSDGTNTLYGSIDQSSGIVSMEENGFQLGICDGQSVYILTYATNTFQKVNNVNLPATSTLTFIDGYFVVSIVNSGKFFISSQYDGTQWAALDFATAESSPDNLLRVITAVGQLWLLGDRTTEIWTDSGGSKFPFTRISGAQMGVGIMAPHTAIPLDNSLFWVGKDSLGNGIVYRAKGFAPLRISTSPIEERISAANDPLSMRAFTYQRNGHVFYVITGGGLETSLVYDVSTTQWHERAYLNATGFYEQHLAACGMFAFNQFIVGDRRNGNVYVLDETTYTDNGDPLSRERIFTHLGDENKRTRYNVLDIGFESGVGIQSGQGSDPQCLMQLSQDGAKTWSNWHARPIGRVGQYLTNTTFRRLGVTQQMTFKIRVTDPIPVRICGAYAK